VVDRVRRHAARHTLGSDGATHLRRSSTRLWSARRHAGIARYVARPRCFVTRTRVLSSARRASPRAADRARPRRARRGFAWSSAGSMGSTHRRNHCACSRASGICRTSSRQKPCGPRWPRFFRLWLGDATQLGLTERTRARSHLVRTGARELKRSGVCSNAVRLRVKAFEILEQRVSLGVSRDRGLVPSLTGLNLEFARGDVTPRALRGAQSVCSDFARWSRTSRRTDGTDGTDGTDESLQRSNARLLGRGVCGDGHTGDWLTQARRSANSGGSHRSSVASAAVSGAFIRPSRRQTSPRGLAGQPGVLSPSPLRRFAASRLHFCLSQSGRERADRCDWVRISARCPKRFCHSNVRPRNAKRCARTALTERHGCKHVRTQCLHRIFQRGAITAGDSRARRVTALRCSRAPTARVSTDGDGHFTGA